MDERTLRVHAWRGWLATRIERVRNDLSTPFYAGQHVPLSDMDVEIREVNGAGAPVTALFRFHRRLDDPRLHLFVWQRAQPIGWKTPPVGETVHLDALPPL